jgi:uncharacterized protein YbjT (DUF2867 family)
MSTVPIMPETTILVTGATGNVGRELVPRLLAGGARVRRLTRNAADPGPMGTTTVVGDLTDPVAVRAALQGVDAVFLVWPLLDAGPAGAVIAQIAAAAPRVVYLSSTAVDDTATRQSDPIVQVHAHMEVPLRDAGLRATVLRSDTLASNVRGWAAQLAVGDVVSGPDIAPTAVVDERDVAAAAAAVLLGHDDPTDARTASGPYLLTGPEVLSRTEQVGILGRVLGRRLRFEAVPPELARARMLADGRPEPLVDALLAASAQRPPSTLVTDHVERLTRRPARDFTRWVADHADELLRG